MAWVFNYGDCEGNTHDWTYTYTIDMPDFTLAADAASTVNLPGSRVQPATPTVTRRLWQPDYPNPGYYAFGCQLVKVLWRGYSTIGIVQVTTHDWTYIYTIDMPDFTSGCRAASTVYLPGSRVQPATPTVSTLVATRLSLHWLLHLRLPL